MVNIDPQRMWGRYGVVSIIDARSLMLYIAQARHRHGGRELLSTAFDALRAALSETYECYRKTMEAIKPSDVIAAQSSLMGRSDEIPT